MASRSDLRRLCLTEIPPNTQAPWSLSTGAPGDSDSGVSPETSRPPNTATPESTTRISGGTVIDIPPNTEMAFGDRAAEDGDDRPAVIGALGPRTGCRDRRRGGQVIQHRHQVRLGLGGVD